MRNYFIWMNVRYIQAIAKWVDTKLIKLIGSTKFFVFVMAMFTKWCSPATFARNSSSDAFYIIAEREQQQRSASETKRTAATGEGMAENPEEAHTKCFSRWL